MARRSIPEQEGVVAVRAALARPWAELERMEKATAVRFLLQLLEEKAPGNSVEVRVPPWGAVQCIQGPRHTRGTPPNVVELADSTWVALATGGLAWDRALGDGAVLASGTRADLSAVLPVRRFPSDAGE